MSLLTPLMNKRQLLAELNVGNTALSRLRTREKSPLPKPIALGGQLYWRRDEIEDWLKGFLPARKDSL